MRAAIYLRVSTTGQTTENQRLELERVAQQRGWEIVGVYEDAGISGAKGRDKRPEFDRLLKDATRGKFDIVAAWSVDRLGRSLQDLVAFLSDLREIGSDLYLHQQAIDTSTPSGRAMFQMLGVFAEFERGMIRERVNAGLTRARAAGTRLGRRARVGRRRSEHPKAPQGWLGHPEDRPRTRRWHQRGATGLGRETITCGNAIAARGNVAAESCANLFSNQ
jgi:DNA invertase Pin-like site-specific DNA recombinase